MRLLGLFLFVCVHAFACVETLPAHADATSGADAATSLCTTPTPWPCPSTWLPTASGGCAPAVLVCSDDGGASNPACASPALHAQGGDPDGDGGVAWRFWLQPDGAIGNGWNAALRPCPDGWTRQPEGLCAPTFARCPDGSAPLPGGGCTHTAASDCPDGLYPPRSVAPADATVVYVRAEAAPDGATGDVDHPYPSIAMALSSAGANAWVLVAAGRYPDAWTVTSPAHVVGVCAARVRIGATTVPAVSARANLDLRGVTVIEGLRAEGGATVSVGDVAFESTQEYALHAVGAGTRVTVRGARFSRSEQLTRGVVSVVDHATLSMTDFSISGGTTTGIVLEGDVQVSLRRGVVRGLRMGATLPGHALIAADAAQVDGSELWFDDNIDQAITLDGMRTRLTLDDSVVQNTQPAGRDGGGKALQSSHFSVATLRGVRMSGNANATASAFEDGTLVLRDCAVLDSLARGNGTAGRGVDAHHRGHLILERVLVEGSHEIGVFSFDQSTATLRDVLVRRTRSPIDDRGVVVEYYGVGVVALQASLDARRVLVEDSTEMGVAAVAGEMTLDDVIVRGVRPSLRGFAMGAASAWGAHVTARRFAVVDAQGFGIGAQKYGVTPSAPGTWFHGEDVYVARIQRGLVQYSPESPTQPPEYFGAYGIAAGDLTDVTLDHLTVDDTATGVAVFGPLTVRGAAFARVTTAGLFNPAYVGPSAVQVSSLRCTDVSMRALVPDTTVGDPRFDTSNFNR